MVTIILDKALVVCNVKIGKLRDVGEVVIPPTMSTTGDVSTTASMVTMGTSTGGQTPSTTTTGVSTTGTSLGKMSFSLFSHFFKGNVEFVLVAIIIHVLV